jgi:hypothetical protein
MVSTRTHWQYQGSPIAQGSNFRKKCQTLPLGVAFSLYSQGLAHPNRQGRFKNNSPTLNQGKT